MNELTHVSAEMLRLERRWISELVYSRLESSSDAGKLPLNSQRFAQQVAQFETRIHILAACIEFQSSVLLDDYVRWVAKLPSEVSPVGGDIVSFLAALNSILQEQFPSDISSVIKEYTERSIRLLRSNLCEVVQDSVANPHQTLQQKYLAALLGKHRHDAVRLVSNAVDSGIEIESIYLDVIQPSQQEIGRLWQTGKISVAEEHYCTAVTQFVMAQLQSYFPANHSARRTLVATCVGDELHEVGLRIVTDLLEVAGWNTIYLGANLPPESIAQTIVSEGANLLALSTTMTQHLFGLAEVIRSVRTYPGCEQVKIMVGGYPFLVDPFLWKRVGADTFAVDAKDAIRIANQAVSPDNELVHQPDTPSVPPTLRVEQSAASTLEALDDTNDDMSRLNNSLVTLQRQLNKANVQLTALNKENQEKAEALQRADRRKDEFLAMLAHELRGPLAPMQLAVSLLQMDDLTPSVVEEARETMKRQLRQMGHLISDLLDSSRIAHGKIELRKETLDLNGVIQRAIEIAHPLIEDRRQQFTINLAAAPIKLEGDEIRLTQVFANLLTNAAKYTDSEGCIWLSTNLVRGAAIIEVRDNGVGIAAELLPDVFSTFTQERRSRKRSMGGLGLGLSLVKQLVELHGGTVNAESQGEGCGCVFSVTLPALESVAESEEMVEPVAAQIFNEPAPTRRVLIVEDTAGIARMTSILFEKLGHIPMIAVNGAAAIQKYEDWTPEIVVLDLELPDMSGFDVTRAIRRQDPENRTLVVALTGHSDNEHRRLATESGCDHYLVKPVDIRELRDLATHPKFATVDDSN